MYHGSSSFKGWIRQRQNSHGNFYGDRHHWKQTCTLHSREHRNMKAADHLSAVNWNVGPLWIRLVYPAHSIDPQWDWDWRPSQHLKLLHLKPSPETYFSVMEGHIMEGPWKTVTPSGNAGFMKECAWHILKKHPHYGRNNSFSAECCQSHYTALDDLPCSDMESWCHMCLGNQYTNTRPPTLSLHVNKILTV